VRSTTCLSKIIFRPGDPKELPWCLPAFQGLGEVSLQRPVAFFVGENGTGKSMLLEGIATACGYDLTSGSRNNVVSQARPRSLLGEALRLVWHQKLTRGFFFRAESFFNFASYLDRLKADLQEIEEEVGRPLGSAQVHAAYGGRSLHTRSHGEAFWELFSQRFRTQGLYLMDEPEAALSPLRQLAFLALLRQMVEDDGSQFLIATHSPIILAYPEAQIYSLDRSPMAEVGYEETESLRIVQGFLSDREGYLRRLFQ
jgi:predicted ATPase